MKSYILLFSSVSLSAFAATPNLSGTFMSQCHWMGFGGGPDRAMRSFLTFSENTLEVKKSYYSDSLCSHELLLIC